MLTRLFLVRITWCEQHRKGVGRQLVPWLLSGTRSCFCSMQRTDSSRGTVVRSPDRSSPRSFSSLRPGRGSPSKARSGGSAAQKMSGAETCDFWPGHVYTGCWLPGLPFFLAGASQYWLPAWPSLSFSFVHVFPLKLSKTIKNHAKSLKIIRKSLRTSKIN